MPRNIRSARSGSDGLTRAASTRCDRERLRVLEQDLHRLPHVARDTAGRLPSVASRSARAEPRRVALRERPRARASPPRPLPPSRRARSRASRRRAGPRATPARRRPPVSCDGVAVASMSWSASRMPAGGRVGRARARGTAWRTDGPPRGRRARARARPRGCRPARTRSRCRMARSNASSASRGVCPDRTAPVEAGLAQDVPRLGVVGVPPREVLRDRVYPPDRRQAHARDRGDTARPGSSRR